MDQDALTRALMAAGFGMMGARNPWEGLARGGMFGMQQYDQGVEMKEKRKLIEAKLLEEQLQAQQKQLAIDRAKKMQEILGGGGQMPQPAGSQRSVVDAPGWKPQVPARGKGNMAQMLLDAGFMEEAKKYAETQGSIHGEAYGDLKVTKDNRPYYMTKQGPRYADDNSIVPREKLHFGDTGDRSSVGFDPFTGAEVSGGVKKGMSPAELDAQRRGWAGIDLQKSQFDRGRMVFDPARGGVVNLDSLQFKPATQDGQPLQPLLSESQKKEISDLDTQLAIIRGGMKAAKDVPSAFSFQRGVATMAGAIPETIAGRQDTSEQREARSYVFNIASKVINERAGAAQSAQELARLRSFLPAEADTAQQVQDKLAAFERYIMDTREARAQPVSSKPQGRQPSPAEAEAELMRRKSR